MQGQEETVSESVILRKMVSCPSESRKRGIALLGHISISLVGQPQDQTIVAAPWPQPGKRHDNKSITVNMECPGPCVVVVG